MSTYVSNHHMPTFVDKRHVPTNVGWRADEGDEAADTLVPGRPELCPQAGWQRVDHVTRTGPVQRVD